MAPGLRGLKVLARLYKPTTCCDSDKIAAVDSDAAIGEMRRLAREFGLFVGPSSGAHLAAARELRARTPACSTSSRSSATRGRNTSTTTSLMPDQA
jgi:cysteine synthase